MLFSEFILHEGPLNPFSLGGYLKKPRLINLRIGEYSSRSNQSSKERTNKINRFRKKQIHSHNKNEKRSHRIMLFEKTHSILQDVSKNKQSTKKNQDQRRHSTKGRICGLSTGRYQMIENDCENQDRQAKLSKDYFKGAIHRTAIKMNKKSETNNSPRLVTTSMHRAHMMRRKSIQPNKRPTTTQDNYNKKTRKHRLSSEMLNPW